MVYHLLCQGPKTGAELMDEIERFSRGLWRPSPGSVYPLLEEMTRDGVLRRGSDGRYALTSPPTGDPGWSPGRLGPRTVDEAVVELRGIVSYLEDLKPSRAEEFGKVSGAMKDAAERLARISE